MIFGYMFILQFIVYHSCFHYQKREDGINVNAMNFGHDGRQRIIHDFKMTKTCLGEFMLGGFEIIKVGDTQNIVFNPNDFGPYEIPIN